MAARDEAIVTAGKGGGGKSTSSSVISSIARYHGRLFDLFDADVANPTLSRYFKEYFEEHSDHILRSSTPDDIEAWLEEVVFPHNLQRPGPTLIDFGANLEGVFLDWVAGRGRSIMPRVRAIVPIDCRDAVTAAVAIANCISPAQILLVINLYGGISARHAEEEGALKELVAAGASLTHLPHLRRSMTEMHKLSIPPDILARSDDAFQAQGALALMRTVEEVFAGHEAFVP